MKIKKIIFTNILFWLIIAFLLLLIIGSLIIREPLVGMLDAELFFIFIKTITLPIIIFLLLVRFLLPELEYLFTLKTKGWKSYLRLFQFYLITGIFVQFIIHKMLDWLTNIGSTGYTSQYANLLTPLIIFFVRKAGGKAEFKNIIYANMIFVMFFMAIEVPWTGYGLVYTRFLSIISGILFPTLAFTLIDILLPRKRIEKWLR
jgi:hypothetical protein